MLTMRTLPLVTLALVTIAFAPHLGCNDPSKGQSQAAVAAPVSSAAVSAAPGVAFVITPQTSKVEWTGSKVTGSHDGSFAMFSGAVTLVDGAIDKSRVSIDIDTTSLTTAPEGLIKHLKSADFFSVDQFPKASFASTSIKAGGDKGAAYQVTGNLTLHGVTKSISFPANIAVAGDAINADATFSINRKQFGLNYPGKATNDLIRDDVVIKLTIHAAKS
jgi:polyisoprenoid-binding protein YceI